MDPNDSDGSWEFVEHKDSDSDTSSVAYDTGLPDENLATPSSQNEELIGSVWNNHDDFITDSDIEACVEDPPVESDEEADITMKQDAESSPEPDKDDSAVEMQSSGEHDSQSSSSTLTKSELSQNEEYLPQIVAETNEESSLPTPGASVVQDDIVSSEAQLLCSEGVDQPAQEVTSQETTIKNASLVDDIMEPSVIESDRAQDSLQPPSIISTTSSHSDFERIDSASDLGSVATNSDPTFEPEAEGSQGLDVEIGEIPSLGIENTEGEESDEGSITFAVISAPSPAEIFSHKVSTSVIADDGDSVNHRSIGMVTEAVLAKLNMVDMATEPITANQKTVGMVTDHANPSNQRLLISFIAISFGVGFLLGATVPMPRSIVLQHPDESTSSEPVVSRLMIRDIYKKSEDPLMKGDAESNDILKYKLFMENTKLRSKNRGLRSSISRIKQENNQFMTKQSDKTSDAKQSSIAFTLFQQSCQKSQRLYELKIENKDKEIKQLKGRIQTLEKSKYVLNTSMTLYKRLQFQHSLLTTQHEDSVKMHAAETARLLERQESLKHRLQRYRSASRNLIQRSMRLRNHNLYLESVVKGLESRPQHSVIKKSTEGPTMSPLLMALKVRQQQTCHLRSKFKLQVKLLNLKIKGQRSQMRKLEQEVHLKSIALEKLYNAMGETSNYANCIKQQLKLPGGERAKDAAKYCRSSTSEEHNSLSPRTFVPLPQCTYQVNGTLAADFSVLNISIKSFKETSSYKLQFVSDQTSPVLYLNSSLFVVRPVPLTPTCDKRPQVDDPKLTTDTNATSVFGPKFVPVSLYTHVMKKNVRAQHELANRRVEFSSLVKTLAVNNHTLDVSRKETENMENRLVVATRELKRLRKEKKTLNQKLENATIELSKKPTIQQCLNSALDTEDFLKQVNDTEYYKKASKMAQKVKRATNKAWDKLKYFMSKFGDLNESQEASHDHHESHQDSRNQKRNWKSKWSQKRRDFEFGESPEKFNDVDERDFDDDDDEDRWESKKSHEQKRENRERIWEYDSDQNKERRIFGPENKPQSETRKKRDKFVRANQQIHREARRHFEDDDDEEDDDDDEDERLFFDRRYRRKHHKNDKKEQNRQEKSEYEKSDDHERKERKGRRGKRNKEHNSYHKHGKRTHRFHEVFGKHVKMAEEAGKTAVEAMSKTVSTQLMPIYDKWQKVYCDIEKRLLPKSFSEIWESLGYEKSVGNIENDPFYERLPEEQSLDMNFGWELYRNFTGFLAPVLQLPDRIVFGEVSDYKDEDLTSPAEEILEVKSFEDVDTDVQDDKEDEDLLFEDDEDQHTLGDPQWFSNMFKARESLRKNWVDSPLSEEEFDWFLRMFEGREELRKSENYPSHHSDKQELNWFLKMFEARARLRFENKDDEKNWYFKMSEARNKARSDSDPEASRIINWYEKMSKARENLREKQKRNGNWYFDMARQKDRARKTWKPDKNGDWFSNRMKMRQKSRETNDDENNEARYRRKVVPGMNKHR